MRATEMELDGVRDIAQVGHQAYFNPMRAKTEADGVDGVVWNRKAVDLDVADAKCRAGLEAIQARSEFAPRNRGRSQAGNENRDIERSRERD